MVMTVDPMSSRPIATSSHRSVDDTLVDKIHVIVVGPHSVFDAEDGEFAASQVRRHDRTGLRQAVEGANKRRAAGVVEDSESRAFRGRGEIDATQVQLHTIQAKAL